MTDHNRTKMVAYRYAKIGWTVVPVDENKRPYVGGGVYAGTRDQSVISSWWARWPAANIAIACGPLSNVMVIDVDPRNDGLTSLSDIQRRHGPLEETCRTIAQTPSGGRHYVYRWPAIPDGLRLRGTWGRGIDVLGRGKYFLVSPSRKNVAGQVRTYEWIVGNPGTVGHAPDWMIAELVQRIPTPAVVRASADPRAIERARRYLMAIPGAVSGHAGHTHTFLVAQKLVRGWGLDTIAALELMREWNTKCDPRWSESELRRKINQAAKYGTYSKQLTEHA